MQVMKKETSPTQEDKAVTPPLTPQEAAHAIMEELIKKAVSGDLDAITMLKETTQEAKLEKLRKELFGV